MSSSLYHLISFYLLFVAQKGAKRPGTEAKSVIIAFAQKSQGHSSVSYYLSLNLFHCSFGCCATRSVIPAMACITNTQTMLALFPKEQCDLIVILTVPVFFLELLLRVRTAHHGTFVSY